MAKEPASRFDSQFVVLSRYIRQLVQTATSQILLGTMALQTILGPSDQLESQKEEPDAHR